TAVATAPQVLVRDAFNNPVANVGVTFAVTGGGGTVVPVTSVLTAANGTATATSWTLGTAAGTSNNTLSATAAGVATPATFTASATAGSANSVIVNAGNNQSAAVNTAVATAPQVLVRDAFNNPVANVGVTFAVTGGGGAVVPVTSVLTAANGTATATSWTLGAAAGTNNNTLSATAAGVATPATFTASATAGGAASISIVTGNNQSATVGTAVATAPQVIVRDASNNPVANVSVTFAVTGGGGVVVPVTSVLTAANGTATVTSWTLGTVAGTNNNTLSATATGVATPATFTASATAGSTASVVVNAGNGQSATVNTAVATAPQVLVRDAFNNPVPNASVTFAITGGGGAVVPVTSVLTAANGIATATSWTLGTVAGTNNNTLSAAAAGVATPATFTASATAGSANSVIVNAGNNQSATVNTAVATAPQVLVRDAFNNPVANVGVTFAVTGGGGTVVPVTSVLTAANGTATATSWTLGTVAGTSNNTLSATAAGVATPATLTASATAGSANSVIVNAGNNQSAAVNTAVATAPQVLVRDAFNNPVANVGVTFAVTGGGGAVVPVTSVLTAANGTATATSWTLGTVAGTSNNTLSATAAGVATPATFTASATAGSPTSVIVNAGSSQSATVNTAVATDPQVLVRDAFNNPVPNASVTFAVTGGGGSVTGGSQTTNASGLATVTSWTLGTVAGTSNNTLSATAAGVATPATFTASATTGTANSVVVNAGNGQSATVNTAVATAPQVLVRDAFNNPVANVSVTFSVTSGGGTVVPTTAILTAANGTATATSWTLGTVAGASNNTLSAAASGVATPATFTASATAGAANSVVVNAGNNQSATVNTAVATDPQVLVRDAFNNPVPNVSVTFAVTAGGGAVVPTTGILTATNGTATVTSWTLGTVAGTSNNTLSATATGVATPATFAASATAGSANSVIVNAGNGQSATVNTAVATDPQVLVRDAFNNLVANASVTFAVTGGGGAVVPTTAILTAANGTATATSWTLGTVAGTSNNTLSATAAGVATPATFTASATAGTASSVIVSTGNSQSATVNTAVATDPRVLVRDAFNNPVANVGVTFAVAGGGGSVTGGSQTTDASGLATVTSWTLGTVAGTNNNSLSATAAGVATPATFTASATAGAANNVIVNAGNNQTTIVNTVVTTDPQVLVRDAFNNPVANVSVTFAVTGGGGSITGGSQTTNASGLATVTSWTLGNTSSMSTTGTYANTLSATASGVGTPASFTGTARYSFTTHVNPIWTTAPTCTGCHSGTSGGSSGLSLGGTAAQNYAMLANVNPICDASLVASGYRRASTATGTSGRDLSFLWRFMLPNPTDQVGACGPHSTKASAANIAILEAWVRNGAPNN
ncbi:MAG: Ig-like domain-containing protein, partial [Longimicrobiales bacterium]